MRPWRAAHKSGADLLLLASDTASLHSDDRCSTGSTSASRGAAGTRLVSFQTCVHNTTHNPTTHLTPPSPPLNTQHSCLLIGANGAGKSTLLRILGGRHLTKPDEAVTVMGMNAFRDTKLNMIRAYMDTDWGMRTVAFAGACLRGCVL